MIWQGFLMEEKEIDRRFDVLWGELSKLKETLSIDEFSQKISDTYEIPFDIAKSYTLIANNYYCQNSFYSVLVNIKRLLETKMFCDVYDCCRVSGEEETYKNAIKYMQKNKIIAEVKKRANRPLAWDKDIERLLQACGDDVDKAVSLILQYDNPQSTEKTNKDSKIRPTVISYSPRDCEAHYQCACGYRFGSWDLFHQKKNANGTGKYCPGCKRELEI